MFEIKTINDMFHDDADKNIKTRSNMKEKICCRQP